MDWIGKEWNITIFLEPTWTYVIARVVWTVKLKDVKFTTTEDKANRQMFIFKLKTSEWHF